jgi:hypothetical protein
MARKTAKQRAQEDLDLAERIQVKADARAAKATEDLKEATDRYAALLETKKAEADTAAAAKKDADQRVKFLKTHPALNDGEDGLL